MLALLCCPMICIAFYSVNVDNFVCETGHKAISHSKKSIQLSETWNIKQASRPFFALCMYKLIG